MYYLATPPLEDPEIIGHVDGRTLKTPLAAAKKVVSKLPHIEDALGSIFIICQKTSTGKLKGCREYTIVQTPVGKYMVRETKMIKVTDRYT
jgi:hypothetical protein